MLAHHRHQPCHQQRYHQQHRLRGGFLRLSMARRCLSARGCVGVRAVTIVRSFLVTRGARRDHSIRQRTHRHWWRPWVPHVRLGQRPCCGCCARAAKASRQTQRRRHHTLATWTGSHGELHAATAVDPALPTTTGRDIGARRAVTDTLFAGCGCGINSARTDLCVDMASNNRHAKSIQISHQSMPQKDFSDIFVLYVSFVLLLF